MAPLRFITTGNFLRMVSYPAWLHCVSSRQETIRVQFPIRHNAIVFHTGRKLFAYSFLSDMVPLRFITTGNFSTGDFSTPLEMTERHGAAVFHTDRKLFANGFLSDMAPLRFIPTGNFSPIVSHPAWLHCVSYRQETFREWFPIRHGAIAFHLNRKLFAYSFLPDMAPLRFISTGNFSPIVSYPAWLHCVSYRQEPFCV